MFLIDCSEIYSNCEECNSTDCTKCNSLSREYISTPSNKSCECKIEFYEKEGSCISNYINYIYTFI